LGAPPTDVEGSTRLLHESGDDYAAALDARMTNLPSPWTLFAGRRGELEEIDRMFPDPGCRLHTARGTSSKDLR
jgi:hypothetical protein